MSSVPKIFGVIGHPIAHSLSPLMHSYWMKENQINAYYIPIDLECSVGNLMSLACQSNFSGFSITIPFKEKCFELLSQKSYCDFNVELSPVARRVGAINMVAIEHEKRRIHGGNTDVIGFQAMLTGITGKSALVIGAGGAARAVVVALAESGFAEIYIFNRTKARATELVANFPDIAITPIDSLEKIQDFDLVVNSSAMGMNGSGTDSSLLNIISSLKPEAIVCDIVYKPLITPLLAAAAAHNLITMDGLDMLIAQGAAAFAHWFGIHPIRSQELKELLKA